MTTQVNIRLPDEIVAELDRWAAEGGLERGACAKDLIIRAIEARLEGRTIYDRPVALDPADLQRLVTKLDEQMIELDRVLRQNAKRDAELARMARTDTKGVSEARGAIVADVVAQMRAALEIIHGEMVRTREGLATLITQLQQTIVTGIEDFGHTLVDSLAEAQLLKDMSAKLDRVEKLAAQPRKQTNIRVGGGDATLGYWATKNLLLAGVGTVWFAVVLTAVPAMGVPVGTSLAGGGRSAFCNIAENQYDLRSCKLTDGGVTITMTAVRARNSR